MSDVMDVRLPNGTVISNVPIGTTKEDVMRKAIAAGLVTEQDFSATAESTKPAETQQAQESPAKLTGLERFWQGVKDPAAGIVQLGAKAASYIPGEIGRAAVGMQESLRRSEEEYQQRRGADADSVDVARMAGNVLSPINLFAGSKAATLAGGATKPIQAGVASGVVGGAISPTYGQEEDFATAKIAQTALGGVGGGAGGYLTNRLGAMLAPKVSEPQKAVQASDITLTPGQLLGDKAKQFEQFAESFPFIGGSISKAKERQLQQFNLSLTNKALSKIDANIPEGQFTGRNVYSKASELISDEYSKILQGVAYRFERPTHNAITALVRGSGLPAQSQKELTSILKNEVYDKVSGKIINGEVYKGMESDLRKRVVSLLTSQTDADRQKGEILKKSLDVIKSSLRQQYPQKSSALRRVDSAYADMDTIKIASAKSKSGVFTPEQYGLAIKQADETRKKSKYALGKARGQQFAEQAYETMGTETNAALAGRLALLATGAYGAMQEPATAAAVYALTPALYSKTGMKAIQAIMTKRPDLVRSVGEAVQASAGGAGGITGQQVLMEYQKQSKTQEEQEREKQRMKIEVNGVGRGQ